MGLRDDRYHLNNEVELDDGFFETVSFTRDKKESLKRGRRSQRQTTVPVLAESKEMDVSLPNAKYKQTKNGDLFQ